MHIAMSSVFVDLWGGKRRIAEVRASVWPLLSSPQFYTLNGGLDPACTALLCLIVQ